MMQPGEPVYEAIVGKFGPGVVLPDGSLNRSELARLAFAERRVEELNAIVHPAVIAQQAGLMRPFLTVPQAIVVVESALIFSTKYGEAKSGEAKDAQPSEPLRRNPRNRTGEVKIARFIERCAPGGP